jgi:uncharacterized protein (DUF427 family)
MIKAIWNDALLAESDDTTLVEGNRYFPPESVNHQYLVESEKRSTCPWKGEAYYYHVVVGEQKNEDAAWHYPQPKEKALHLKNYVAFWKGVQVED